MQDHPIAIVEDRYGGVYSRGEWIAVGEFDARDGSGHAVHTRLDYVMEHAHGDDVTAMRFWADTAPALRWLAVGATPDEALANLRARIPTVTEPGQVPDPPAKRGAAEPTNPPQRRYDVRLRGPPVGGVPRRHELGER